MRKKTKDLFKVGVWIIIFQCIDLGLHLYGEKFTYLRFISIGVLIIAILISFVFHSIRKYCYIYSSIVYVILNSIWVILEILKATQELVELPVLFWIFFSVTGFSMMSLVRLERL